MGPRWLASPVAGTIGVLAALSLLAIPLRKVTSIEDDPPARTSSPATAARKIHAVVRLRLLAPVERLMVQTTDGAVLLEMRDLAAGESEHDVVVPLADGGLDLTLQADFGTGGTATAVFLTLMPDGYEEQTRYAIGTGQIEESLRYEWPTP